MEEDYQEKPRSADGIDDKATDMSDRRGTTQTSSSNTVTHDDNLHESSAMMDRDGIDELRQIATHLSTADHDYPNSRTNSTTHYSNVKPESPDFDPAKWARSFMRDAEDQGLRPFASTGILFRDLRVSGTGAAVHHQQTVGTIPAAALSSLMAKTKRNSTPKRVILHDFNGLLRSGELLLVLGRPGAGCSTLLKTLCGELAGLRLDSNSTITYDGIPQAQMKAEFKGEVIYNQEVDKHFPHLTVGQTLEFAAAVRTPSHLTQKQGFASAKMMTRVIMAICGLSHTYNTKVGDDFVRGVSGGEKKRVSIAEMMLAGAPVSAWDNSTRGLDAATALKFVQTLRLSADLAGCAHPVALYQASQGIYDLFAKTTVLYEGHQIYFGPASAARDFFERQGWYYPPRQTTGDFLTSVTNPIERKAREGMEDKVPRTPEEFAAYWKASPEFAALQREMEASDAQFGHGNPATLEQFRSLKHQRQARHVRPGSPYTISIGQQLRLNVKRAYQRVWGDKASTVVSAVMQVITALIIGSIFYSPVTYDATAGFYAKGAALFIAVLSNALTAASEITTLYAQRPIIEKHASYAFYHPSTEALAGIVADVPVRFITATCFNVVLYFMADLRREAGQFFLFFFISYISSFIFSGLFRSVGAATRTSSQAMAIAGILILALTIYTGFMIAVPAMKVWFSWLRWLNPLFYGFETLVANEFHGHEYICSSIVPAYTPLQGDSWICSALGSVAGRATVNGDAYIMTSFSYTWAHTWRNVGILIAFLVGFTILYMTIVELTSTTPSSAQYLVFQRGRIPAYLQEKDDGSLEQQKTTVQHQAVDGDSSALQAQTDIFSWKDVVYDIEIKGEPRRLLDNVAGWVKPGTLTALMGVSGAGKTTLLDALAQRTTMGVITGDMLVNGQPLDASFQRKTGYVQQQDLHLETATVRESLRFSARLRQPPTVSKAEKYEYVEEVIRMLNMSDFADAVVGIPGEGLNVEQRKLLTIGVELAAKPKLLLFLDEPTSGLDSQSSWAIVAFLRKLADAGQAVLCTIHQPSAILFQQFDRLLFLARGGRTVYFGDIGDQSSIMLHYFESKGARPCEATENPAEYLLDIGNDKQTDWHDLWLASDERRAVDAEIERMQAEGAGRQPDTTKEDAHEHAEFAMPFSEQLVAVTVRVFQQYWRMPSYLMSKFALGIAAGLFIGFSFYQGGGTLGGMQMVLFAVFQIVTLFSMIVMQIQPLFVTQRALYEVRERPSKAYSWKAFLIANVIVEIPYQILAGILTWACFYFPVVGANQHPEQQGVTLLLVIMLFLYSSSFAQMTIAALPDATTASAIVQLLTLMSLMFCGVLQTPQALPGFWIFMYYVSPFTYWVAGMAASMLHERAVHCTAAETSVFSPPQGQTCGEYLAAFLQSPMGAVGSLQNPGDTVDCRYCSVTVADQSLAADGIYWSDRWRNFGIMWAYVIFNIFVAVMTYWLFRVRPAQRTVKAAKKE